MWRLDLPVPGRRINSDHVIGFSVAALPLFYALDTLGTWLLHTRASAVAAVFVVAGLWFFLYRYGVEGKPTRRSVLDGLWFATAAAGMYWHFFVRLPPERWV